MAANSGSGGVRNLRAMFENKAGDQSTSPPSRGRSPNPSEFSNGSRPVSKVRASFVAVERPGENGGPPILGLRRASEVSSLGGIQENAIMDGGSIEKTSTTRTEPETKQDARPQVGRAQSSTNGTVEGGLGKILKGSSFESSTPSKAPKASSDAKKLGEAISSGKLQSKAPTSPSKEKDSTKAASMVKNMKPTDGIKPGPPPATTLQTTKTAQPIKPPPTKIATKSTPKSPTIAKPSPKTPTSPVASIRGGPAKIRGVMESARQAQQARAEKQMATKQEKTQSAPKVDTQVKAKPASDVVKKEKAPSSPQVARSPKVVKPKSPTRPVKLPLAATANTASSAAKDAHHSPTEPDFRKSVTKKPSTLSIRQPRASISSTTSTLAKKPSRASLVNGHDRHERPKSRVSTTTSKPDEGFLARMMRPTASSAQKTHDKVQVNSPPRPKTSTSHRPREGVIKKAPPKMHLEAPHTGVSDSKEIQDDNDQSALPEEVIMSPVPEVSEEINQDAPAPANEEDAFIEEATDGEPISEGKENIPIQEVTEEGSVPETKEEDPVQEIKDDSMQEPEQESPLREHLEEAPIQEVKDDVLNSGADQEHLPSEESNHELATVNGTAVEV